MRAAGDAEASAGEGSGVRVEDRRLRRVAASFMLAVLSVVWTWWALADGAFFEVVLFPGTIIIYLALAILLGFAPLRLRGGGPHEIALLALVSLALWTIVSLAWTPARDLAFADSQRTLMYAAAFAAGLWTANLLGRRVGLAIIPLAVAAIAVVGATLAIALTTGSADPLLDSEGTLDFPFGYRNASAAFLLMALFLAATVAARRQTPAAARAAAAGIGAVAGSLCLLAQSRGSVLGAVAGAAIFLLASRQRLSATLALMAIAVPVGLSASWMLEPFSAFRDSGDVEAALNAAGLAALLAGLGGAVLGLAQVWLERRGAVSRRGEALARRSLIGLAAAALLAVPIGLLATGADPVDWVEKRLDSAELSEGRQGSRFEFTGGLERSDFWRVSLRGFIDSPLLGDGAGGFRTRYLQEGTSDERPLDAHSIPIEILGELGLPGLLLLLLALGAAATAALRSRRLGPEAAFVTTAALSVGAVWLGQGSIDWFWAYAGLSAPALALLGAAAAPQALSLREAAGRRPRRIGTVALLVLSALLVPPFLSARLTNQAAVAGLTDPPATYDKLDRAAALNPFADQPLLVKAQVAMLNDDPRTALEALEDARAREPDAYFNYEIAARVLEDEDPAAALAEVRRALVLNPRFEELQDLERRLQRQVRESSGSGG